MQGSHDIRNTGVLASRMAGGIILLVVTVLWFSAGFSLLKVMREARLLMTLLAIVWGCGVLLGLFLSARSLVRSLPMAWQRRIVPFVFVGPAVLVMGWYLFLPIVRTFYLSFFDRMGSGFVGLSNYLYIFTDRTMRIAFANNLIWLVVGTGLVVFFGLVVALLADRMPFERTAKTLIFLPMSISFVGAGVIWRFVYAYQPPGSPQYGVLNALVVALGGEPQNWIVLRPWNTFFLIVILVWLYTGFAMVIFSAALKGIPKELREAAHIDGAGEFVTTVKILIPCIKGTIVSVSTTIILVTLKIFDIVYTMTNGLYGSEVLASQQYKQMFKFLHYGRGSAIAVVIFLAVIPIIWYNLRQFGRREVFK
ncbi:carbohydrate ABC transporter permease [Spirochaeta thermophila]|uniref:Transporter n=1 Tax=Winmispira thermophila (strain ATCC 49972 / DSM 6192 / RI 19.B1) TaxID=665571 RepID=E0RTR8_WINT6|nr:sugar ABC transporter permease [Spirochaeta thermophila]ADN02443.1 transporter [Spirochaeta thermophila DSM 6192]